MLQKTHSSRIFQDNSISLKSGQITPDLSTFPKSAKSHNLVDSSTRNKFDEYKHLKDIVKESSNKSFLESFRGLSPSSVPTTPAPSTKIAKKHVTRATLNWDKVRNALPLIAEMGDAAPPKNIKFKLLGKLIAGDFIGHREIMRSEPHAYTVIAAEPCKYYTLNQQDVLKLINENPDIALELQAAIGHAVFDEGQYTAEKRARKRKLDFLADIKQKYMATRKIKKEIRSNSSLSYFVQNFIGTNKRYYSEQRRKRIARRVSYNSEKSAKISRILPVDFPDRRSQREESVDAEGALTDLHHIINNQNVIPTEKIKIEKKNENEIEGNFSNIEANKNEGDTNAKIIEGEIESDVVGMGMTNEMAYRVSSKGGTGQGTGMITNGSIEVKKGSNCPAVNADGNVISYQNSVIPIRTKNFPSNLDLPKNTYEGIFQCSARGSARGSGQGSAMNSCRTEQARGSDGGKEYLYGSRGELDDVLRPLIERKKKKVVNSARAEKETLKKLEILESLFSLSRVVPSDKRKMSSLMMRKRNHFSESMKKTKRDATRTFKNESRKTRFSMLRDDNLKSIEAVFHPQKYLKSHRSYSDLMNIPGHKIAPELFLTQEGNEFDVNHSKVRYLRRQSFPSDHSQFDLYYSRHILDDHVLHQSEEVKKDKLSRLL